MKIFYYGLLASSICGCTTHAETRISVAPLQTSALIGNNQSMMTSSYSEAKLDSQDRKMMERLSPRTVDRMDRGEPLTLNDVIKLSQGGVDDSTVMNYMKETHSTYNLSQAQIRRLQDAGVSQRVVSYMVDSGR